MSELDLTDIYSALVTALKEINNLQHKLDVSIKRNEDLMEELSELKENFHVLEDLFFEKFPEEKI